MDYIFKQAAKRIFDRELPDGPLKTHSLRNTDFQEICLEVKVHKNPGRSLCLYL